MLEEETVPRTNTVPPADTMGIPRFTTSGLTSTGVQVCAQAGSPARIIPQNATRGDFKNDKITLPLDVSAIRTISN